MALAIFVHSLDFLDQIFGTEKNEEKQEYF